MKDLDHTKSSFHRIITLLFNACTHFTSNETAYDHIRYLRDYLSTNSIIPNNKSYGSLVNALSRNGFFDEAVEILKEIKRNKVKMDDSVYNGLLSGCLEFKTGGFQQALKVIDYLNVALSLSRNLGNITRIIKLTSFDIL
jgi:pentatricopeptide repeat protein